MSEPQPSDPTDKVPEPIETIDEAESFDVADGFNVPVHVGLHEEKDKETDEKTGYWALRADGFLPRKDQIIEDMFGVRSKDPEQLRQVVAERVIPLYEAALENLRGIADGSNNILYEWQPPVDMSPPPAESGTTE
jgi:hypothetical protein